MAGFENYISSDSTAKLLKRQPVMGTGHSRSSAGYLPSTISGIEMDDSHISRQLILASGNATLRHLYARTATFVDTQDRLNRANWKLFSGTFVQIKQRLFVATVSHSIDNVDHPSRYVLTTKSGHPHPNSKKIVLKAIAKDNKRPDIGLIELNAEMFREFHGLASISTPRISIAPPEGQLASLMGTPSETVKIHPLDNEKWGISGTMSGFTTVAVNIDECPELKRLATPLDSNVDLLVRYPNSSPDIRDDAGVKTDLPKPHGLSGGGLWIHNSQQRDLWLPENCQLVGIQSSWFPDAGYVRLTRISHWLDLVYSNYPDLRDSIDNIDGYKFGEK